MADQLLSPPEVQFKPWREVWAVHWAAEKMPAAAPGERAALAIDIERHGLQVPIEFCVADDWNPETDGGAGLQVLDGRTRFDALHQLGYRFAHPLGQGPLARDADGRVRRLKCLYLRESELAYPFEHVVSLNIMRRHLSSAQKRDVIAELLKDAPERSNREVARITGVDDKTVGTVRRHLEIIGELLRQDETVGRDGRIRTSTPRRTPNTTVKVERTNLARLEGARTAQDSGDLFRWSDGPQKIARVLVEDGMARASLAKVEAVLNESQRHLARLKRQAELAKPTTREDG
jgi:hypothetical protein